MVLSWWRRKAKSPSRPAPRGKPAAPGTRFFRPCLEALEARLTPADHTWTGAINNLWSVGGNWAGGAPAPGETAVRLFFPGTAANITNNFNDIPGGPLTVTLLAFQAAAAGGTTAGGYTITGNPIVLTGGLTNNITAANTNTLALNLTATPGQTFTNTNANTVLNLNGVLTTNSDVVFAGAGTTNLNNGGTGLTGPGLITQTAGTLNLNTASNLTGGVILTGGTMVVSRNNPLTAGTLTLGGGTLQAGGSDVTFARPFVLAGTVAFAGGNRFTFTGPGLITSNSTLNIPVDAGAVTVTGTVSGSANLAKAGTGTLVLSGVSTYTGTTTVSAGILDVQNGNALGTNIAAGVTVAATATLRLNNAAGLGINKPLSLNGVGAAGTAGALENLAGNNFWAGNITLAGATTIGVADGTQLTVGGVISGAQALTKGGGGVLQTGNVNTYTGATNINAGTWRLVGPGGIPGNSAVTLGGTLDLNNFVLAIGSLAGAGGVLLGSGMLTTGGNNTNTTFSGSFEGSGGLAKVGTGVFTFVGSGSTYTGPTVIAGGTLTVGAVSVLPPSTAVTVQSGGTLNLNNFSQTIGSLAGAGPVTLGTATLTAGGDNTSTVYSGVMSGGGNFVKAGTGTLAFLGNNTYTGSTGILGGTLVVNGNQGTSAVTVGAGGTLAGTGTVGQVNVAVGGTVAPGATPGAAGTLSVNGNLIFTAGSTYAVDVNGTSAGTGYDQLNVTLAAALIVLNNATLRVNATVDTGLTALTVIRNPAATPAVAGTFNSLPEGTVFTAGATSFRITYVGNVGRDVVLNGTNLTLNRRFINQAYLDLLGRPADADGLAFWDNQMSLGVPRAQIAASIESTVEFRVRQITDIYQTFLGRRPDQVGLNAYLDQLLSGVTVEQVKANVIASPEYYGRNGGTNDGWLNGLYRDVLGRLVGQDPAGFAFFTNVLISPGGSLIQVATMVVNSLEAFSRQIGTYYRTYLRRFGEPAGINAWAQMQAAGLPDEAVIANIVGSQEYLNRLIL